jgi:hypothetical protein
MGRVVPDAGRSTSSVDLSGVDLSSVDLAPPDESANRSSLGLGASPPLTRTSSAPSALRPRVDRMSGVADLYA